MFYLSRLQLSLILMSATCLGRVSSLLKSKMVGMRKGHYLASEKCPLNRAGRVRVLSHLSKPRDNPLVSSVVSALAAFPEIEGSTLLVCVSGGLDSVSAAATSTHKTSRSSHPYF